MATEGPDRSVVAHGPPPHHTVRRDVPQPPGAKPMRLALVPRNCTPVRPRRPRRHSSIGSWASGRDERHTALRRRPAATRRCCHDDARCKTPAKSARAGPAARALPAGARLRGASRPRDPAAGRARRTGTERLVIDVRRGPSTPVKPLGTPTWRTTVPRPARTSGRAGPLRVRAPRSALTLRLNARADVGARINRSVRTIHHSNRLPAGGRRGRVSSPAMSRYGPRRTRPQRGRAKCRSCRGRGAHAGAGAQDLQDHTVRGLHVSGVRHPSWQPCRPRTRRHCFARATAAGFP